MTTEKAFKTLIESEEYRTVFNPQTRRSLKMRFKKGALTVDTLHYWLNKAGFKHSEDWKEPLRKKNNAL